MSALEHEIIQKFHQLDKDGQQRVKALIDRETVDTVRTEDASESSPWDAWLQDTRQLRDALRDKYGKNTGIDITALVREVREEDE